MKEKFYDVDISVAKRESFNNTIILLTMIKSEYYYIISFSRPKGQIKIGFDYKSDMHDLITESITVDFYNDNDNIVITSEIKNINLDDFKSNVIKLDGNFYFENEILKYRLLSRRDDLFPVGAEKMNAIILRAKAEIFAFLERYFQSCINKNKI